ncbi:MAG: CDP-alcohol phosphatidyltransferase family protein [Gemmatimonadales bacterium]
MTWTLPNILTVGRILLAPVITVLPFFEGYLAKLIAVLVFVAAAISDIYDGHIARTRGEITELGKILDPFADKLLLVASLIPIYWLTRQGPQYEIPWGWGALPVWVVILIIGREALMTIIRQVAKHRGVVIAAAGAGKLKTIFQDIFLGTALGWFFWKDLRAEVGLDGWLVDAWESLLGASIAFSLAVAVLLTGYSLGVYLSRYRHLFSRAPVNRPGDGH